MLSSKCAGSTADLYNCILLFKGSIKFAFSTIVAIIFHVFISFSSYLFFESLYDSVSESSARNMMWSDPKQCRKSVIFKDSVKHNLISAKHGFIQD